MAHHTRAIAICLTLAVLPAATALATDRTDPPADPVEAILRGDAGNLDAPGILDRFRFLEYGSTGMQAAIHAGDRLIIDTQAFTASPIVRGDIVEYRFTTTQAKVCGASTQRSNAKRIVGVPGDRVEVRAGTPDLLVNGATFTVPGASANPQQGPERTLATRTFDVPAGAYLVLGDNRADSCDSHQWDDPYVPAANIRGRVEGIYFPRDRVARTGPGGALARVDVTAAPRRPRFDYLQILGRAATRIATATALVRECAAAPVCDDLAARRDTDRLLDRPLTTRLQELRYLRVTLAGAIKTQLRVLATPTGRIRDDCAGPTARWVLGALARDRRVARSRPVSVATSRRIAAETERHLRLALTRTVACWE